jgi:acetyl-CoA carboxylase biotin carboxyl carrier protein
VELDLNALRELLAVLNQTEITELTLKSADFELTVRKGSSMSDRPLERLSPPQALAFDQESRGMLPDPPVRPTGAAAGTVGSSTSPPPASPPQAESKWVAIKSPMVGTFYRSPAPNEPPFVEVGDRIRVGQTICIIEAMKLMNEIEAEVSGQVMEILVANGNPVEFDQILLRINPD